MKAPWTIEIVKSYLKFSAGHMTVYPDGTKEALHGHNYQVGLKVHLSDADRMIDFHAFKKPLKRLCDAWDEKILVQGESPHARIETRGGQLALTLCGKKYEFPEDEVLVLPLTNISSEQLARHMAEHLASALQAEGIVDWQAVDKGPVRGLELSIYEIDGQGASYRFGPGDFPV